LFLKNWIFPKKNKDLLNLLSSKLEISNVLLSILISRGIDNEDDIIKFLDNSMEFSDSLQYVGMKDLIERIKKAIENFEKICIFGDYDADGITSTVLMYLYFCENNIDVMYMIPSRYKEGYGLSIEAIDEISKYGVKLIFTVDNGISSFEEVEYAKSLGMDVIITDHHKIPDKLPNATAVVDPHLNTGFKDFAGVGVAFKVVQALENNKNLEELISKYGDLLVIGTIGDCVPLLNENRKLLQKALSSMCSIERIGTRILFEGHVSDNIPDSVEIAFGIVPKINACGRIGSPEIAAKLLLAESIEEAREYISILNKNNEIRKSECAKIFESIQNEIIKNRVKDRVIFGWSKNWSHGLIGIIASNVSSKFGKPCFLFSIDGEKARGSVRSIDGLDVYCIIQKCSHLLTNFGGHSMACGVSLETKNLENFKSEFLKIINNIYIPFSNIQIDYVIEPEQISIHLIEEFQPLKPFGNCNPEPIFGIINVELVKIIPVGGGQHLRLHFLKKKKRFEGMLFGVSASEFFFEIGNNLDLAVRIKKNCFTGLVKAAIHIVDIKFANLNTSELIKEKRTFEDFLLGLDIENPIGLLPNRDDFIKIFKLVKSEPNLIFKIEQLYVRLSKFKINLAKIYVVLEIFNELGIITISGSFGVYNVSLNKFNKKLNLNNSEILKKLTYL